MYENYLYYAESQSGHIVKVLVEVLQSCLTNDAYFTFEKGGIKSCNVDNKATTLINFDLPMEKFEKYFISPEWTTSSGGSSVGTKEIPKEPVPMTIAITIKHLHKLLKNVKKKDSITFFIDKSHPLKLGIRIVPVTINKKSERAETSHISFRTVENFASTSVPEDYHPPKVIPATEYQKMCKKMAVIPGKDISITIQRSNFICFFCDGGNIVSSEMTFGEKETNVPDGELYVGNFYTTMLNQLIKMPGLSSRMQISAPKNKVYPIRIKMDAGNLGTIEVYLKTKELIEMEASKKNT